MSYLVRVYTAFYLGCGFGLFMAVSVGPTIFAIIKYSITYGWRAGMSFVLGVSLSDSIYVLLANMASAWLSGLMSHEKTIGYLGAVLLIIFGLYGFFKKIKVTRNRNDDAKVSSRDYFKIFASGFLMNTLNPGVIITWITAVAAISTMTAAYRLVFFITCLGIILGFDFLKVLLAQRIRRRLTPRNIIYLNRISALCLVGIGIVLFLKSMFDITFGAEG
jgi:threonine/homoserine/homoserine lactone efflux protein